MQGTNLAPPFLTENTLVNCNGGPGFAQGETPPDPETPSSPWPEAKKKNGETVNLRFLTNDPDPNVVSFKIEDQLGWITAANPQQNLLIGYLWRTADYPWVSV